MDITVNFSGRALDYTEEEIAVVVEAMKTANPLTQGRFQDAFQKKFRAFNGAKHAFAVCNGTCALELVAQLCLLQEGDEIIVPLHTFTSSAYPFIKKGGSVVWADIDPVTRVITAESIERVLSPRTRVIVVVHLYGYVADMPAIMELARKRNILVVEDACQAIGADIDGVRAGNFGDFGVFSFHSHKNLTTLGEGGMITVNDDKYAAVIPMLRHNGHCAFPYEREDYWLPAMGDLDFPELDGKRLWPNNFCLGEIECALGAKQLDRVDSINREKRARALAFIDALADYPELLFHRVDSTRHNYHLLPAKMDGSVARRDDFIRRMMGEHGVKCVVQYYPLNRYPLYKKLGLGAADCPAADDFFDRMISFPFQHNLTEKEFGIMLAATKAVLDSQRQRGLK
jgi:dTDP-4-amino-4,6-dideoxygalactose transaminase